MAVARLKLELIEKRLGSSPDLEAALAAIPDEEAAPARAWADAVSVIRAAAERFVAGQDGSHWEAIDPMVPTSSQYRGQPRNAP